VQSAGAIECRCYSALSVIQVLEHTTTESSSSASAIECTLLHSSPPFIPPPPIYSFDITHCRQWLYTTHCRQWLYITHCRQWLYITHCRQWLYTTHCRQWLYTTHCRQWLYTTHCRQWLYITHCSHYTQGRGRHQIDPSRKGHDRSRDTCDQTVLEYDYPEARHTESPASAALLQGAGGWQAL
jgi:hypothetical protein